MTDTRPPAVHPAGDEDGLELPANARALLDAVVAISSDLDRHSVLDRIVVSACQIAGAKYGALGVIGHSGGLLIDHLEPIRLSRLTDHPKSYGFPAHHPPMERFLGVPDRIRGTVFGNL